SHRFRSLFSSPEWIEVMARTYGMEVWASVLREGRREAAVLFSHIRDVRGERIVCLPFTDYCDPLVDYADAWDCLISPPRNHDAPIRLRCLRNSVVAADSRFTLYRTAKWHATNLTRADDEMWAALSGQARQNIRHASQCGVVVREGASLDDVRTFYRMHAHTR